jgi:hypothetical protein
MGGANHFPGACLGNGGFKWIEGDWRGFWEILTYNGNSSTPMPFFLSHSTDSRTSPWVKYLPLPSKQCHGVTQEDMSVLGWWCASFYHCNCYSPDSCKKSDRWRFFSRATRDEAAVASTPRWKSWCLARLKKQEADGEGEVSGPWRPGSRRRRRQTKRTSSPTCMNTAAARGASRWEWGGGQWWGLVGVEDYTRKKARMAGDENPNTTSVLGLAHQLWSFLYFRVLLKI